LIIFIKKVRNDALLGPIFNRTIDDWPTHLQRLTGFWETNLFFVSKFKGNPILKHQRVDAQNNHSIDAMHFGVWLNLWFETLDEHFHGEIMNLAKNRARNMGSHFYLKIFEVRPKTK
jgi:hemoglobin